MTFPLRWRKRRSSRYNRPSVHLFRIIHLKTTRWAGRRFIIKFSPTSLFVFTLVRLVNIRCCATRHRTLMLFPRGTVRGSGTHTPLMCTPLRFRIKGSPAQVPTLVGTPPVVRFFSTLRFTSDLYLPYSRFIRVTSDTCRFPSRFQVTYIIRM